MVGMSPPRSTPVPFGGRCPSARRLARILDVADLTAAVDLENLSERWPPVARVPAEDRRNGAARLRACYAGRRLVIACGPEVSRALGGPPQPLSATRTGDWLVACIPHPSGRNRWWNAGGGEERVRRFLEALAAD